RCASKPWCNGSLTSFSHRTHQNNSCGILGPMQLRCSLEGCRRRESQPSEKGRKGVLGHGETIFASQRLRPDAQLQRLWGRPERAHRLSRVSRQGERDRKSTRLNSSHVSISYAVFCL